MSCFRTSRDTFAICLHTYLSALPPMFLCIGLSFLLHDSLPQVPKCVFPLLVRNLGQLSLCCSSLHELPFLLPNCIAWSSPAFPEFPAWGFWRSDQVVTLPDSSF